MSHEAARTDLPYRPNVGICLINLEGLIWFGKGETAGPEILTQGNEWQMPQGGIEADEEIVAAAKRELREETGVSSVEFLAQTQDWWKYDFPTGYRPTGHKLDPFRGQTQKWVAFRFIGDESEIDISAQHTCELQEFFEWRWMSTDMALKTAVLFKKQQYIRVFQAFDQFLR